MLTDVNLEHPHISLEHQDMLGEEITAAEVKDAVGEGHELSAQVPLVKILGFLNFSFKRYLVTFTAVINQLRNFLLSMTSNGSKRGKLSTYQKKLSPLSLDL